METNQWPLLSISHNNVLKCGEACVKAAEQTDSQCLSATVKPISYGGD